MDQAQSIEITGYSGGAFTFCRGESFAITDLQGKQVADLFAFNRDDHFEYLSTSVTRLVNHTLFPKPGQQFYSTQHRPIVTFVEDNSPGLHDMLFAPCDHQLYAERGLANHPNCRDNYLHVAREVGIEHPIVPDPVNLFQNTPHQADGVLKLGLAATNAGDHVILTAETNLIVIVTACSSGRVNGGGSTPISISLLN